MRFSELLIVLFFVMTLWWSTVSKCFYVNRIKKSSEEYKKKTAAEYFISESFKKTCRGEGFESLSKWQSVCRALWNLEYIGWGNAEDFMNVDYSKSQKPLMYGKWQSVLTEGEVFCRSK